MSWHRIGRAIPPGQSSEVGPWLVSNWSHTYLAAAWSLEDGLRIGNDFGQGVPKHSVAMLRMDPVVCEPTGAGHRWISKGWPVVVCAECPARAQLEILPPLPPPVRVGSIKLPMAAWRCAPCEAGDHSSHDNHQGFITDSLDVFDCKNQRDRATQCMCRATWPRDAQGALL